MRPTNIIQFLVLFLALVSEAQDNRTISDVYVNLPATCAECRKVKYEITAYNGCYDWKTLNPQIISLEKIPDHTNCFNKAALTAIVSRPIKTVVIIRATDSVTKETLISQVKVSRLAEFRILTNFKAIDVDDVQKLYIQAFDDSNNVISSVEGLRFEWRIETNTHALKVITSKEANYENTPVRLEMEQKRFQTDLVLVRGMQTGIVEVSARILEKDYEEVGKARIVLFVIEPFFLIPDKPVYLLTNSEFVYRIAKGKRQINGKLSIQYTEVKLPNSQYRFIAGDNRMLSVSNTGAVKTKGILGEVLVRVEDTTLVNNTVEGLIYVVEPDMLELSIRDVTTEYSAGITSDSFKTESCGYIQTCNWNLVVSHIYAITSCLFDNSKNVITLTPDVIFDLTYSEVHLKLLSSNPQRSVIVVKAIAPETRGINLRSTLAMRNEYRYRAFADKQLKIFPEVKVDHPLDVVILPYLARTHISLVPQMWTLTSSGGSGIYKWESANPDIVAANNQGTIFGLRLGTTQVTVSDSLNPFNNNTIRVEVTRIAQLEWVEEKMELALNSKEPTSVIAYDEKGRKFTNCTEIPLAWLAKDGGIISLREEGERQYENIKKYVHGQGKELIKLRHSYDKSIFDETKELHNLFGICCQRIINTIGEGMGRIIAEFSINEEGGIYYKRASAQELILVYKPLSTMNPSYENFLKPLRLDERDESYRKYLQQFKSENEYVLAYGSGLLWEIAGGTYSWADLPGYYSEDIKMEKTIGEKEIELKVHGTNGDHIKNNKREHYLECPVPSSSFFSGQTDSEFKLILKAGNKRAKSLLRPAENVISLIISCQVPETLKLAWAQRDLAHCESLPRKESGDSYDVDTYFIKNGQVFNTRMLAFDKYRRIIYNFSSCGHEQTTTDTILGNLKQLDPYYLYELSTTQKTGSFFINGGLVGLNDQRGWKVLDLNKVKNKMKINSVNMLRIEPQYKLLYLHEGNTVTIELIDGSGSFSIRPNVTGLVDIHYNPNVDARKVSITPLREGYVSVIVEDRGISSAISAACTIVVSGINRITLKKDQLLEHETSTKMQLSFYSLNGEAFPLEQYKFIAVNIVAKKKRGSSGLPFDDAKGLVITPATDSTPDFYNAFGKEVGGYELIASVRTGYRPEVYSNPIYIEVFPALKIYPSGLLLLPDGSYTLKMSGGPFSVLSESDKSKYGGTIAKSFQSADPSIVEVNGATGEIKTKRVGDTTIDVILTQEINDYSTNTVTYETLCKRRIPISVRLATGVEVVGIRKREILSGATIKIIALLKSHNETFTHAIYPVEYTWTSKQFNVFSLRTDDKREDSVNIVQSMQPAVEGTAHKPGEADILLHVVITYPEMYRNELHEFTANSVLRVLDPLHGNVPTFIDTPPGQTTTYLIPPKCMHRLPPNKENNMKLTYRQLCNSMSVPYQILSITEENLVTTGEHYGSTAILVEESTYNPLRTAYYVEVAPIHSVVIQRSSSILSLPLGADISLKVVYQDHLGRSFADLVEGISLRVDISHPGVIRADLDYYNSTLTVRALALGNAILHIYKEDYILDIIRVQVSSVIDSSTHIFVHLGGTVQFKNLQGYPENKGWVSDNPSVIKIDSISGIGKAAKEGTANVNMDGVARLKVTCGKIKHIALHIETSPKTLTNMVNDPMYKSMYPIQFKLYGDDANNEIAPTKETTLASVNQRVEFECRSQNPEWVIAKAEDPKGSTVCLIYPKTDSSSSPPLTVTIEVSAGSKEFGYTKTERFSFPFASGFGVIGSKELMFSKTSRSKTIKVSGSNNIRVWAEDPLLCDIRVISEEGFSEVYVSIPRDIIKDFKNIKLYIQNVQTDQKEIVLLSYSNQDSDPDEDNKKPWSYTDIIAFIIMIITILVIAKYILSQNNRQYNNQVQNQRYYPRPMYRQPIDPNYGTRTFQSTNILSTFVY
jgi:hypothetical protein